MKKSPVGTGLWQKGNLSFDLNANAFEIFEDVVVDAFHFEEAL